MSFFDRIRFLLGDFQAAIQGQALAVIREADPDFPPTVGEMAQSGLESVGRAIGSVWTWMKIILIGAVVIFIVWLFIGRKK